MTRRLRWSLLLILLSIISTQAVKADDGGFTLSLAAGAFDVDTDDSEGPHLNELSYNVLIGYTWTKYIAVEAELMHVESASEIDVFGERSAFGGDAVGLSIRLQWPLADDFTAYLRLGGAAYKLSDTELLDEALDESQTQPIYGGGIRGHHWFVEYVTYGKIEDYYPEQLRGGLIFRF